MPAGSENLDTQLGRQWLLLPGRKGKLLMRHAARLGRAWESIRPFFANAVRQNTTEQSRYILQPA